MKCHRKQVTSSLSDAISHAAISMFVTSATTAVAFFANLASEIMVLRVKSRINQLWCNAGISFDKVFSRLIPQIVYIIRIPLILLTIVAFGVSLYAIIKSPGIRLPEKNSIQFLRSNHPYEWFDENAATLFDFSIGHRPKMNVIAIWGIKPTISESLLNPNKKGSLNVDIGFADVLANHLLEFQALLKHVSHQINPSVKQKLWLDEFIKWTNLNTTTKDCQLFGVKQSKLSNVS
uniref:SSD domain-containing protein n=1 Tax=Loa loa TaxID=7209 RepID=A0A1I7VRN8_LOALO